MARSTSPADDTPPTATRQLLRHDGPCGIREQCWRAECRAEFGDVATVERFLDTGDIIARCHGSRFNVLGMTERAA